MERGRRVGWYALGVVMMVSSVVLLIMAWRAIVGGTARGSLPGMQSGQAQAGTSETGSGTADADTVHTQWVAALQHDDRVAALALSADEDQQTATVDADLQMMQRYVPAEADTGGLTTVAVQPVTANGTERMGVSVWTFVKSTACFQATLNEQPDGGWRVREWVRVACR